MLHGISLTVPASSVFALVGPNGAGKSTAVKVAGGRLRPTEGRRIVSGVDATRRSSHALARTGVCSIPEGRGVFPNLTVAENLRMWTFRGHVRARDVEEQAFSRFPQLAARRKQQAGTLSGGEQQMLAVSRALSTSPKLLLLDELSMGLAPVIVAKLYEVVSQLASEGIAILVVEQFARIALSVADGAALLTQGRVQLVGTPAEIDDAVEAAYLAREVGTSRKPVPNRHDAT